MLAVIDDYQAFKQAFKPALPALERIGWTPAPEPGDEDRRKWSVCFPTVEHRTHHLHVVEHDSVGWRDWMLFRDFLRAHVDEAMRYGALKKQLAAEDRSDRVRYRAGKAPLITELLERARAWSDADRGGPVSS